MKKRLFTLLLCVVTAVQMSCAFAYEYTPYIGEGVVRSTPVSVVLEKATDAEGVVTYSKVDSLDEATRVTASCKIKPGAEYDGTEVKVSLIAVAYSQECLAGYSYSTPVTFDSLEDGAVEISAVLDITDLNAEGIKVFLWDTIDNARPLLNMGEVGNTDKSVEGIIVGTELVEFDENNVGSIVVNAGYVEWPEVIVLTNDLTTDVTVELEGLFPLSKPYHAMAGANTKVSGETKTAVAKIDVDGKEYTVNVTQEIPQITDVLFKNYADIVEKEPEIKYYSDSQVRIQYDVQNPVWTDELPGPNAENTKDRYEAYHLGVEELEGVSFAYSDTRGEGGKQNAMILCNISPELVGSHMIAVPWNASANSNFIDDAYKFTIDRSARIYVECDSGSTHLGSSWTRAYNNIHNEGGKLRNRMYYEFRCSATGNSLQTSTGDSLFYKDYEVEPGTTCEISLPVGPNPPKIFVKYADTDFVTNIKRTVSGSAGSVSGTTTAFKPFYRNENLTLETGKYNTLASTETAVDKFFEVKGNLLFGTAMFTGDSGQWCLIDVPDELVGATVLRMPAVMTGTTKIEFDIGASARVYVFTNAAGRLQEFVDTLGEKWSNTSFNYDGDTAVTWRGDGKLNVLTNKQCFVRDYIISPDDSGHVTIDLPSTYGGSTRIIVAVKPLEK